MSAPFDPQVCVVDFHHHNGPEIEFWVTETGQKLYDHNDWSLLPFMALSDGAHAMIEDFSYFSLLHQPGFGSEGEKAPKAKEGEVAEPREGATTLFGIACTRQIRSDRLKKRSKSVTRSSVQKSVVVIVNGVAGLGELRTRLGMVTEMWFSQEDFTDTTILKGFQESLVRTAAQGSQGEPFFGLSLREVIHEFRHQTLVLVKCLLLQRKMLFFSSKCERLCLLQFALLSLLPGLTSHLENAAHPSLESTQEPDSESTTKTPRAELLESFGQPLPIFSKGAFFSPYTPLQHLDMLGNYNTKSYVVGSTNSLLLQQQSRYADMMINLDTEPYSLTIFSPSLKQALTLSTADRRWIDNLTQQVLDTWDPEDPSRPKNHGYAGSEEMIRSQFEEYILSLSSCMAYQVYRERTDGTVQSVMWKDEGQETGVVSIADQKEPPELEDQTAKKEEKSHKEKGEVASPQAATTSAETETARARPESTASIPPARSSSQTARAQSHLRTSSLDVNLPPADLTDNAIDFRPEYLAAWRETRNFELFIASVSLEAHTTAPFGGEPSSAVPTTPAPAADASKRPRIFDLIPPAHPTGGGLNIDDVQRRLQQSIDDFRTTYKVDERYRETRENVGKAIEAGRERWGKWWSEMEERRRRNENTVRSSESAAATTTTNTTRSTDGSAASAGATTTSQSATSTTSASGTAGTAAGTWSAAFRERASKVQKPDPAAIQAAAKENAAKAGAYLSSWGSWARDKSRDWQDQRAASAAARKSEDGVAGAGGGSPGAAVAEAAPAAPATAIGTTTTATTATTASETPAVAPSTQHLDTDPAGTVTAAKAKRHSAGKFTEDID